jgi:phospholipase/carboxylesterase
VDGDRSAWWSIDEERRAREIAQGARDLYLECPTTRPALREQLETFTNALRAEMGSPRLAIGGFSQGGMMSCDAVLHGLRSDALILLSSSRIAFAEWQPLAASLAGLPVFISHGNSDADLSFAAGTELKGFHTRSGAKVTWIPFEGGHEIPLVVWRALRTFLKEFAHITGS